MVTEESDGNGGRKTSASLKLERKDKFGIVGIAIGGAGLALTVVTVVAVPLLNSHFQSKLDAVLEHAQIRQDQAVAGALANAHGEDYKKSQEKVAKFEAVLVNLKINQTVRMREEGLQPRPMPAGLSIDRKAGTIMGDLPAP